MTHALEAAGEERAAMNLMLTNPDVLADYVNDFFGPEGPYPTETPEETATREQYEAMAQLRSEIEQQEQRQVPAISSVLKWKCRPLVNRLSRRLVSSGVTSPR